MTSLARVAARVCIAAGTLALVRLGSFVPYTVQADGGAVLRLAWRARGERVDECRRLTPEELAKLPVHMRQEEICEGRLLPYRLVATLDGSPAVDRLIHGAGAREDRPLYVFQDLSLHAGAHRVTVAFTRVGAPPPPDSAADVLATPPRLTLDTTLMFRAGTIVLLTYDEQREQLVVRRGSSR